LPSKHRKTLERMKLQRSLNFIKSQGRCYLQQIFQQDNQPLR
jgi:hypothetical protein